jgi:hypothetical protein
MNQSEAVELGDVAMGRDPRHAPYGWFSGGSFVLDNVRVFMWFETIQQMTEFIMDVEPFIWDLEGDELDAYKTAAKPILDKVILEGLTESARVEFNKAMAATLCVEWWGRFEELAAGETKFSQNMIESFLDSEDEGELVALAPDQIEDFIEHLKVFGY